MIESTTAKLTVIIDEEAASEIYCVLANISPMIYTKVFGIDYFKNLSQLLCALGSLEPEDGFQKPNMKVNEMLIKALEQIESNSNG